MYILFSCIIETKVIPVLIVKILNLNSGRQMNHVVTNHVIRWWGWLAPEQEGLLLLLLQDIGIYVCFSAK